MIRQTLIVIGVAIVAVASLGQSSHAQFFYGASSSYKPSKYSYRTSVNGIIQNRPTVSPYLTQALNGPAIFTGVGGQVSTYQSIVRPELDRREQAVLDQRQYQDLQRQVQVLRHDFDINMQRNGVSTGHPTRFMTYSHYYPRLDQPAAPRRR